MPKIYIPDGKDHLAVYRDWKKQRWWRKIPRKGWVMIGFFSGAGIMFIILAGQVIQIVLQWLSNFNPFAGPALFGG